MKRILCVVIALLVLVCAYALAEEASCTHPNKTVTKKDATCTADGYEKEYCPDCGTTFDNWPIPAKGHDFPSASADSCKDSTVKCKNCSETKTIPGDPAKHNKTIETVKPTCFKDGYSYEYCTICKKEFDRWDEGKATGHRWTVDHIAATCTKNMISFEVCADCGAENELEGRWEEPGTALGHIEVVTEAVEPTCTEDGHDKGVKCDRCKATLDEIVTIPALDHDYRKNVVEPTTEKRGYTEYSCRRAGCDEYYRARYTDKLVVEAIAVDVAKTGAAYGSIVTDLEDNDKPYTVEADLESKHLCIIATAEADGTFPLRELHLSLALIAQLQEEGYTEICFMVDDAEIVVPFASFEGEVMDVVKADFPATLTGYIITLDTNAKTAEGVDGCLVKIEMSADTEEADGIEMGITGVMTNVNLFLGEELIAIADEGVYAA